MVNFKEISYKTDDWELFARDFLVEQGFFIESPPDRGADSGKDMLVSEELKGNLGLYRFRWLVSCKHFAHSSKSVKETDEKNILDRIKSFKADGFLGFYSTLPSAGLNRRLNYLRENTDIKDYKIFDKRLIEKNLLSIGYSEILQRYLPLSYQQIKPLQLVLDNYEPILCELCGKDLLMSLYKGDYEANFVQVERMNYDHPVYIEDIYCACKGECDRSLERKYFEKGFVTGWTDISDLIIPGKFISYIMAILNNMRDGHIIYSDKAFDKEKKILIALSQKVMRASTKNEKQRLHDLFKYNL
jgi:hypothetical protein